jgi:hypothetical protein
MKPSPLNRYFSVVITRAGRDFFRSSSFSGSCQPPTRETNASRVPSGDQAGAATPCRSWVRATASPPATGMTITCPFFPRSRSDTNASRVPSGDQRGAVSRPGPVVKRRGGAPFEASTIQMLDRYSSRSWESVVSTKATRRPSGEIRGSETKRIFRMSSGRIGRMGTSLSEA